MVNDYRPGMKMYEVAWELDGECWSRFATHAANEAEAISKAQAYFDQHPENDFPGRARMTVHARDVKTIMSERPNRN
jgi:hypothetical protein